MSNVNDLCEEKQRTQRAFTDEECARVSQRMKEYWRKRKEHGKIKQSMWLIDG